MLNRIIIIGSLLIAGCATTAPPTISQGGLSGARKGVVTTIEKDGKRSVNVTLQ